MKFEWDVTLLCFGLKKDIKELKEYFDACRENNYIFSCEENGFDVNDIDIGDKSDVLTVNFPLLYTGDLRSEFTGLANKFKKIIFFAAGMAEAPENNLIIYDVFYAAKSGKIIDTAVHEFNYAYDAYDEIDYDIGIAYEAAYESAVEFFAEGLTNFLEEILINKVSIIKEKVLCKNFVKLCYKYKEGYSCIYSLWSEFPKSFWSDQECLSLVPQNFWDDEEACIALAKFNRKALKAMSGGRQKKFMQVLDDA